MRRCVGIHFILHGGRCDTGRPHHALTAKLWQLKYHQETSSCDDNHLQPVITNKLCKTEKREGAVFVCTIEPRTSRNNETQNRPSRIPNYFFAKSSWSTNFLDWKAVQLKLALSSTFPRSPHDLVALAGMPEPAQFATNPHDLNQNCLGIKLLDGVNFYRMTILTLIAIFTASSFSIPANTSMFVSGQSAPENNLRVAAQGNKKLSSNQLLPVGDRQDDIALARASRKLLDNTKSENVTFALVPKSVDNPFFGVSGDGCKDAAEKLGINCLFIGPELFEPEGLRQAEILRDLINSGDVDGIAVSVVAKESITEVLQEAKAKGVPVVTFDSDASEESGRIAYVGTDNLRFGESLGKVVKQIRPHPGTFRILSAKNPNILDRETGLRRRLLKEGWTETAPPLDTQGNSSIIVDSMFQIAQEEPDLTAILPVMGAGMRDPRWMDFVKAHPNYLIVVADAMPNQLEMLDRGYCSGLVGQLPYEMGARSIELLYDIWLNDNLPPESFTQEFVPTNLLEHILVPIELPALVVDNNLVGELRFVGYVLFGVIAFVATGCLMWTYVSRNVRVVKISQPGFLMLVALGCLLMCSAMLPLGYDDSNTKFTDDRGVAICMSPIWLLVIGFSLTFASLAIKIFRVYILFRSGERFVRAQKSHVEVLIPLIALLVLNTIILILWTTLDPLLYIRMDHKGTDGWDRVISNYGACRSDNVTPFVVPLGILNFSMLIFANWAAYQARGIQVEFAESKYVGMAMASMLQAVLSGFPILFLVRDSPQAYYMVFVFMIFMACTAILLLIFVPKIIMCSDFVKKPEHMQRASIAQSIRESTNRQSIKYPTRDMNTGPLFNASRESCSSEMFRSGVSQQFNLAKESQISGVVQHDGQSMTNISRESCTSTGPFRRESCSSAGPLRGDAEDWETNPSDLNQ